MKRIALLASLVLVASTFAACEGENDPIEGETGGSPGTGGQGATGGMGGEGGNDGGNCPSSPITSAPINSVVIPGRGQVWPPSEGEGGVGNVGGSSNLGGAGGFGGAGNSGCTLTENPEQHATDVACQGTASVKLTSTTDEIEAEFADGSVARFVVPGIGELPESGKADLKLVASQATPAPLGPTLVDLSSRARDDDGTLLWVVGEPTTAERSEIFGASVESVEVCSQKSSDSCGTYVAKFFDHVVQSSPQQRIPADETTTIVTDGRSFDVTWFEATVNVTPAEVCGEHAPPAFNNGFRAVLKSE